VPTSPDDEEIPQRSRRLLIVLGVLGIVSAVVAAMVVFSSGGSTAPPKDPVAPVRAGEASVSVGRPVAETTVVVYEDFGSPESRTFEIASRDFLRLEAAEGDVVVEYRPVSLLGSDYSRRARAAWGTVLLAGTPEEALAFHDVLLDRLPDAAPAPDFVALAKQAGVRNSETLEALAAPATSAPGAAPAGVRTTPTVLVDGEPVAAGTPNALADEVQRRVLQDAG
jgi:protein-disulfide isomerase